MAELQYHLQEGIQNLLPGAQCFGAAGSQGQQLQADLVPKFHELVRRGWVFSGTVAAAAAVPVNTTLTNAPSLWNPASSGKIVIPLRVMLSLGAIGTPILNGFTISYLPNTGDTVGTGLPIATWTAIAGVNLNLGRGVSQKASFSGAVSTYTTNPAKLMDLGFGHLLEGTAASGQLYSQFMHDFEGAILMGPGTSIHFGSTIATSTTYWTTILWAEVPVPSVL